jgi:hypothetical protein
VSAIQEPRFVQALASIPKPTIAIAALAIAFVARRVHAQAADVAVRADVLSVAGIVWISATTTAIAARVVHHAAAEHPA